MPSENFDKKVREAAEQHSPAFDENAWNRMETLLDAHLPLNKERRRRYFFPLIFTFLLLGGGAYFYFNSTSSPGRLTKNDQPAAENKRNPGQSGIPSASGEPSRTAVNEFSNLISKPDAELNATRASTINETNSIPQFRKTTGLPLVKTDLTAARDFPVMKPEMNPTVSTKAGEMELQESKINMNDHLVAPVKINDELTDIAKKAKDAEEQKPSVPAKQKKPGFLSNLSLSISGGPDFSAVGVDKLGKLQIGYGAGISYNISRRLAVRSGLYVARKVYSAGPEDYHASKQWWTYYPNLKNIDANCKVLELPLIVDYNFGRNNNWFVSAGASSVFMKEESYDYLYRPPSSPQYVSYSHSYYNENDHLFSLLHFSGGYTKKLGKLTAIRFEPYLKLPLSGIGHGKIKLASGGLLFSVSVSPFAGNK